MEPGLLDHLIVLGLLIVQPIAGARNHRRLSDAVALDRQGVRLRFYRNGIALEWLIAAVVVLVWFLAGRSATALGLLPQGRTGLLGLGVGVLLAGLMLLQAGLLEGHAERIESARRQMAGLRDFLPHTEAEDRGFFWLSVSAGICEEIVFRGFLIAYFTALFGLWPAALVATVAFGLVHAYQGPAGMLRTGLAGGVAVLLFLGTGWLLAPVLVHIAVDVGSGRMVRVVRAAEAA